MAYGSIMDSNPIISTSFASRLLFILSGAMILLATACSGLEVRSMGIVRNFSLPDPGYGKNEEKLRVLNTVYLMYYSGEDRKNQSGVTLMLKGGRDEARTMWESLLPSENCTLHNNLGVAFILIHDSQKAMDHLLTAHNLCPDRDEILENLSLAHILDMPDRIRFRSRSSQ